MTLPPGQRELRGFPRFGTHFGAPPPAVPPDPKLEIAGAVKTPFELPLAKLRELPRKELRADFHCVAGWSATDLSWEGVPFAAFYRAVIERLWRRNDGDPLRLRRTRWLSLRSRRARTPLATTS